VARFCQGVPVGLTHGIHAFAWLDGEGGARHVRYTLRPQSAGPKLAPREAKRRVMTARAIAGTAGDSPDQAGAA
jgi:hypothetical protein